MLEVRYDVIDEDGSRLEKNRIAYFETQEEIDLWKAHSTRTDATKRYYFPPWTEVEIKSVEEIDSCDMPMVVGYVISDGALFVSERAPGLEIAGWMYSRFSPAVIFWDREHADRCLTYWLTQPEGLRNFTIRELRVVK